jgi:hypothetical protein
VTPERINSEKANRQFNEEEIRMAQKNASTSKRSSTKKRSGRKASSSNASEYIREEMHEEKKGRRKNPKQAIAIGLSRARRAGEDVPAPKKGTTSKATRKRAQKDIAAGRKRAAKKTTAKKAATKKRSAARKRTAKKTR